MAPPDPDRAAELARIEAAYRERDASPVPSPYRFTNPGYAFYMRVVEADVLAALRRAAVALDGARVLEVGCGSGYFLHRLVEFGATAASGVDLMPDRVAAARRRYPTLDFHCADAAELPFAEAEFDLVTHFTCLSSVLDPELRAAIAAEMWRVLRPGGAVLSFDMREPPLAIRALRSAGELRRRRTAPATATPPPPATPTVGISAAELRRIFPAGRLDYRPAGLAFGLCAIAGRSEALARGLAALPALREHAVAVVVKPER